MGKSSRKKKERRLTSSVADHKKVGSRLIPPMMQIPGPVKFASWVHDRLPEMLWACLVISVVPRTDAVEIFRSVAGLGFPYRDTNADFKKLDLTHSCLEHVPDELFSGLVQRVTAHPLGYAALRPLMLLDSLPARDRWNVALGVTPEQDDWQTLGKAVLAVLDHQSQEATDVRWLTMLFRMALGIVHMPREPFMEIVEYPHRGDMRKVRPSIRAAEIAFRSDTEQDSGWSERFWDECLKKTGCTPGTPTKRTEPADKAEAVMKRLHEAHLALLTHWFGSNVSTAVDAKRDTTFGFGLYAVALLIELLIGRNRQAITGRLILRTLVECRITLAFLLSKNESELWKKFRSFGSGQAKLAMLKFDEIEGDVPSFIDRHALDRISNEDVYQEYLFVDLGHWCGLDLRRMAEQSGTKDEYDRYYGWGSAFVHGHWAAMRDACLTTCFNPLHRLHRIPQTVHRFLEDAVPDAIRLADQIFEDIGRAYPGFSARIGLGQQDEVI